MKRLTSFILHNTAVKSPSRASLMCALLFLLLLLPLESFGVYSKHATSIVDTIASNYYGTKISNVLHTTDQLIDPQESTYYYCGTKTSESDKAYLNVTFKEGIDINTDGDLVIYLKRPIWTNNSNVDYAHPIEFEVKGRFNDGTPRVTNNTLFKVFFQYRGPLTEEYSVRIPINEIFNNNPSYKNYTFTGLRFVAVKNHSDDKYAARANGVRDIALNSFDVLKLAQESPYSDTFVDNFHLGTDYGKVFEKYQFVNTQGIADPRNKIDGWEMLSDSEIKSLEDMGITYPDYSFITPSSDKKRNPYSLDSDQKRQATHTVEHTIYALPGDVIPLYPYYGLPHTQNFKENFSHWYEYKSGKIPQYTTPWNGEKVDLLDFLVDPSGIQKTSDNGYYGGKYMNVNPDDIIKVSTPQEYADAVSVINNGKYDAIIELTADIDFSDFDGNGLIICPDWHNHFKGCINGNGHRISNLVVNQPDVESVGLLVVWTDAGVIIENLYIDNTCQITGKRNVGLVGFHAEKELIVRNLHTEATIKAVNGQAGGIVGIANNPYTYITLQDCYIGGEIGMDGQTENAAIAGWWRTDEGVVKSSFTNIVVNCKLHGSDGNVNRKYIRANNNAESLIEIAGGMKKRGLFSFKDCYGNLDKNDNAWNYIPYRLEFSAENLAKLGWTDYKTPPMSTTVSNPYTETITIYDEADYIQKIKNFNANTYTDHRVTIELTQDLDFSEYGPEDVPMITPIDNQEFAGIFNGAGHIIKNLKIIRDEENVGMFARTRNGARIENLILDSSCEFQGKRHVGIVGNHRWNPIIFRNVKTEATVRGTDSGEQACAALVGFSNGGYSVGSFEISNVYIGGVIGNPNDASSGHNNAVICGWQTNSHLKGELTFTNIVVNCELYGNQNQNRMKYLRHNYPDAAITMDGDTYVRSCTNGDNDPYFFRYTNCYGNIDPTETPWQTMDIVTDESKLPVLESWKSIDDPGISERYDMPYILRGKGNRTVGTVATFYCPRDPFNNESAQSLPMPDGAEEYIIAADFSQTFDPDKNVDKETGQLIEPIIAFRHIFRIKDGKKFADIISGSEESNHNYLRTQRKYVSARVGEAFQIRLENPVPKRNGSKIPPSHHYYKDSNGEYREVARMGIKVLDADTRKTTSRTTFKFDNIYPGFGFREIDGVKYALGEGSFLSERRHPDYASTENPYHEANEAEYYLLLTNNSTTQEGHYLVQIVAQDYNGNTINIAGTSTPLVLMEYDINILPKDAAWMVPQDELYNNEKYSINSPEELDKKYATQSVRINFDEYMAINALPDTDPLKSKLISRSTYTQTSTYISNPGPDAERTTNGMDKTWFKWPRPWEQSTYIFGYNDRFDYSMYQVATHSDNVVWKWAAKDFPEVADAASLKGNNPGDGMGLFDRRYYASKLNKARIGEPEQGYFYYVNAASDPGVAATLEIPELCQGSRIVVSAWMAEFSTATEKGNLSFNFVAVLKDDVAERYPSAGFENGQSLILHKYITGYPEKRGEWYNIYYSFFPRLAEFSSEGVTLDMVDHYELQLDNNSRSSNGADYAIDDIRAYVVPPIVDALQVKPTCEGEATRIRMSSPFETLLEIAGSSEALGTDEERNLAIYYTFIDKSLYETKVRDFQNVDNLGLAEARFRAFKESVVKFDYNRGEDEDRLYGKVNFKNKYLSNFPFPENMNIDDEGATETELNPFGVGFYRTNPKTGERLLIFESDVTSGKFNEGNQYYVLLKTSDDDVSPDSYGGSSADTDKNVWDFFDMYSKCANKNVISIKSAVIVRLNGIVVAEKEKLVVCENQRPVIQVNVWGQKDSDDLLTSEKELIQVTEIVPFDWFRGTVEQFKRITEKDMRPDDGNEEHTLEYALQVFRREDKYPEAESVDGIKPDADDAVSGDPDETPQEKLEQWMLDLIGWVSSPSVEYPTPRLVLCKESYTVPAVSLEGGEPEDVHVAVIPITCTHAFDNYIVCPNPKDITVTVGYKAPKLRHGLTYLGYPVNMDDVPLRIGLDQLRRDDESSSDTEFTMKQIAIPVRQAEPSAPSVKKLVLVENTKDLVSVSGNKPAARQEGCIVLLETNDPAYSALGSEDSEEVRDKPLLWIGDVTKLIADTEENANMEENLFTVKLDKDFQFKEGYYYTMRFDYADEGASVFDPMAGSDSESEVCQGQDAFTIKIVPKYLLWTGENNLNWNNDANWQRLDQDELYSDKKEGEHRHYVTDGVNNNTSAYAPLDFTHVVVKDRVAADRVEAPYLYAPVLTPKGPSTDQEKYSWPATPSVKDGSKVYSDYPDKGVGEATTFIQYDMAAYDYGTPKGPNDSDTGCRPWYANTCYQIHFKPGGTIMNQHELTYKKAWVDVELDPSRWYTLSLPLKEVFAGDFYLPTAGARQVTELYQPISFDTDVNDRFRPAVFQRGWDKSTAKVYELEKQGLDHFRNVAIRTFWSHVYNDVTEQYGSGVGFSVKTDVSRLSGSQWTPGNRVMFRFPKADQTFLYYNKDGSQSGHSTITDRDAENQYRLNDGHGIISAQAAENGHYFLVGNPFMTHMDVQKFLDTNKGLLEQQYWIVTEKGQIAGSVSDAGVITATASDSSEGSLAADPAIIPPMQGFFVKAKASATTLSLTYDESMMRRYDSSGKWLTSTTRSEETTSALKISSYNYGDPSSAAVLIMSGTASSDADVMAMDNRDLDVLSTVYTAKAGTALSINFCEDAEGTEIGVIADEDTETVLRFEGVEAVEGLYLLDKADRKLTPLEEGMELTVNGAAAGRYFLTYGIADEGVLSGIEWSVRGGVLKVVDNAASGSLEVNVFDTMGRLVKHDYTNTEMLEMQLEHGMYVVEIRTAKECKSIKVRI